MTGWEINADLPESRVLASNEAGLVVILEWNDEFGEHVHSDGTEVNFDVIAAWMPVPIYNAQDQERREKRPESLGSAGCHRSETTPQESS